MKKFLFLMLSLFIFASCEDECNFCGSNDCDGECQNVAPQPDIEELIVGDWVYVDTKNHIWEKQSLLSNMKLYYSACILQPYYWAENVAGTYYFTSNNNKMSLAFDNVLGGTTYLDYEITEIKKYSYTAKSYTDNGIYGGTYTYNRIIDEIELEFGETTTPRYGTLTSNIDIQYYFSNNEDIATVNASTGKIKAGNVAGLTYINVVTAEGNALIEVKVTDPDNLFPDYSPALNMTTDEVQSTFGDCNNEEENLLGYPILGNDYALLAIISYDENNWVTEVQINLKDRISYDEQDIHNYLSSKYTYQYKTGDIYIYYDLPSNSTSLTGSYYYNMIGYNPQLNCVNYIKQKSEETIVDLWPDYSEEFGKTMAQIKSKYGSAWYDGDYYSYFWVENDYIDFVGFTVDKTTKKCYNASAFLESSCDWNEALNYLNNKYYLYEAECDVENNQYAFINATTFSDATVAINFDGKNGVINYVDLTYSQSAETEDLWPDYSEEFGKTMDEIKAKYGTPYYVGTYYSYFYVENDYIYDVGFSTNESTNLVDAAVAYLETNCDKEKALDFIESKYYYYGTTEDDEPIYIDSRNGIYDATLAIFYNEEYEYFYYMQLTTSRSVEAKSKTLKDASIKAKSIARPKM